MKLVVNLFALALLGLSLGGCGQRGPLYLPETPAPTAETTPASQPTPAAADRTAPSPN